MLKIYYGDLDTENSIPNPPGRFDVVYEPEWIEQPLVRDMIKDIDKSEVIGGELIISKSRFICIVRIYSSFILWYGCS